MKKIFLLLMCTPFLLASTCDNDEEIICTLEAKAGLNITVKDAVSNETLVTGVTVILTDGSYSETLEEFIGEDVTVFNGAWERTGNYVITVSKEGYQTYTSSPITVTADQCHVIPQQVEIQLVPN